MTTHVPPPTAPDLAPPRRRRLRRPRSRTVLVTGLVLVCLAGAVGITIIAFTAGEPIGVALALVLALLPLPVLLGAYRWLDRYEPEPVRYIVAAFAWGAVLSVAIALPVELAAERWLEVGTTRLATFVAPIAEETAKDLFLVFLLWRRRHTFDGIVDGLFYAGLVGIGFAFTENVGYYAASYAGFPGLPIDGVEATTGTFILRGIFSPFAHSLFVSSFGVGLGIAIATRRRWLRWLAPIVGAAGGMVLHGLWNGSAVYGGGGGFLAIYAFGMVPIFAGFIGLAAWARRREGLLMIKALEDAAARGWLHADEIPWLSRFPFRKAARRYAATFAGPGAERAVRDYQKLATKLAFAHHRVLRGQLGPDGPARVFEHLARMQAVRTYVRLPPPLRVTLAGWPGYGPVPGAIRPPPPPAYAAPPASRPPG